MLNAPQYSRVGECCADGETETLQLDTPKNSTLEERHHVALPHLFIPAKEARKHENIHILHKRMGNKLVIK